MPRSATQPAAASAPNQTRRTALPRHPGQGAGPANAGPVHHSETDHAIRTQPESAAVPPRSTSDAVELAGLMHELTERILSTDNLAQALERLVVFTAGAVPGAIRCSVALISEGEQPTRVASGGDGRALDDCQFATGQGPGLDAARTRTMVTAQDLTADTRWPALAECARDEGVHSAAAVPLDVQRSSVGALTIFVRAPQAISPDLLLTAMAIVNQAEILLGELARRADLSQGATVDRAIGVIIGQRGCGVREAFDVLQETAQRLGINRQSVAERLIAAAARTRDQDPPRPRDHR